MSAPLLVAAALLLAVPLAASLTVCAPKWWQAKVVPRLPQSWTEPKPPRAPKPTPWVFRLMGLFAATVLFGSVSLVALPFWLGWHYWLRCVALIHNACPYSDGRMEWPETVWGDAKDWLGGLKRDVFAPIVRGEEPGPGGPQ